MCVSGRVSGTGTASASVLRGPAGPSSWISSLSALWRVQVHLFFFTSDPWPSTPQSPLWTLFTGDSNETAVQCQHLISPFLSPFSPPLKKPISDNTSRLDSLYRVGIVEHNTRKHCELTISGSECHWHCWELHKAWFVPKEGLRQGWRKRAERVPRYWISLDSDHVAQSHKALISGRAQDTWNASPGGCKPFFGSGCLC